MTRRRKWIIGAGIVALAVFGATKGLDLLVSATLREVVRRTTIDGHVVTFDDLRVSPWRGMAEVHGLVIGPSPELLAADSLAHFQVVADSVSIRGVRITMLLLRKVLHADELRMYRPEVEHVFTSLKRQQPDAVPDTTEATAQASLPTVRIGHFAIIGAKGRSTDRAKVQPSLDIGRFDLRMEDLALLQHTEGRMSLEREQTRMRLVSVQAALEPYYTLTVDSILLGSIDRSAGIFGFALVPEVEPGRYHAQVDHQVELYRIGADSLLFEGFDAASQVSHGLLRARSVHLHGLVADIHRDKSIPMGPFKHVPLPSEMILGLNLPLFVDSVQAHNATVRYHERLERAAPYGVVTFTDIEGLLTGLNNLPTVQKDDLLLKGAARFADLGRITLDMRMPLDGEHATLQVKATVRDLPFEMMNRMTDNLVHIKAKAGNIHRVDLHMKGDDRRATGTVDIHYEDLNLEIAHAKDRTRLLTLATNTLVKKQNMPEDRRYTKGEFTVDRNRDKGVFNYLWSGLREGMLEVMLPPWVLQRLRKHREAQASAKP